MHGRPSGRPENTSLSLPIVHCSGGQKIGFLVRVFHVVFTYCLCSDNTVHAAYDCATSVIKSYVLLLNL